MFSSSSADTASAAMSAPLDVNLSLKGSKCPGSGSNNSSNVVGGALTTSQEWVDNAEPDTFCEEEGQELKFVRRTSAEENIDFIDDASLGSSRTSTLSNSISNLNISSSFHQIPFDKSDDNITKTCPESTVFLLGRSYDSDNDYGNIRLDEGSLFWFTYRRDFPELAPYGLTSDAGWGCMLRASQMLLAQALRMHFQHREWRPARGIKQRKRDPFVRDVMTWFADFPGADCPYSLHNMVACGLRYEKLPGEWYGPQTAAFVMRDLCHLHRRQKLSSSVGKLQLRPDQRQSQMFRIFIAQESCVYHDAVEDAMTQDERNNYEIVNIPNDTLQTTLTTNTTTQSHPLANIPNENNKNNTKTKHALLPWDTSLLLLIPLRLGLKRFNNTYSLPLSRTFSLPQSCGFIGGSPRHALYFYGATSDGSKVHGLDPHTVQLSPERDKKRYGAVNVTDDYLRSVHCTQPSTMSTEKIDPSLALAFYCKDRNDFLKLCRGMEKINEMFGGPELFTVEDKRPNYNANVGLLAEMISRGCDSDGETSDEGSTEEDEYVFL